MTRPPLVEPSAPLDATTLARYSRHLNLPGVGETGQRRIANAKVLVIGAGGLGSPIASYLVAAGIGHLGIVDDDVVELSNLQRQIIHRQQDIGAPKVASVQRLAREHNSQVQVTMHQQKLQAANALALFSDYDLVIDGSDNFATRYLSNDAAEITGTPLVWGTLFQFSGQVSVFDPRTGPMLRDLFPEIPDADSVPSCADGGVFGALCGVIGSVMSTEALKLITGIGTTLSGKLWLYDALETSVRSLGFAADPHRAAVRELGDYQPQACAVDDSVAELGVAEFEAMAQRGSVLVVDVREAWERQLVAIPGSCHLPLEQLLAGDAELLDGAHHSIVMACKSGVRSRQAARYAAAQPQFAGKQIFSLQGGTLAWQEHVHGEPIVY